VCEGAWQNLREVGCASCPLHWIFESERPNRVRAFLAHPTISFLVFVPSVNGLKVGFAAARLSVNVSLAVVRVQFVEEAIPLIHGPIFRSIADDNRVLYVVS
jgi:hypothetical protein